MRRAEDVRVGERIAPPAAIGGEWTVDSASGVGAATNAVKIASGWPKATVAPIAARVPFHRIQLTV